MVLFMERDLLWCDVCGKDFRKREYLGGHVVLFKKGVCLSVMFEGKHFRRRQYLGNHLNAVQEGVSSLL